jgi:hypothetical protein
MWTQLTGKTLETMTVWADASERMLKDWVELGSGAAKESLRLYGELQTRALEGAKALAEGKYGPETARQMAAEGVQTLTRVAERMQATAEQTGKGIQATLTDAVAKTKEIYARV